MKMLTGSFITLGDTPLVAVEIFKQNYKVKIWKYKLIAMQHPTKARRK
jgi:hypothetical protein